MSLASMWNAISQRATALTVVGMLTLGTLAVLFTSSAEAQEKPKTETTLAQNSAAKRAPGAHVPSTTTSVPPAATTAMREAYEFSETGVSIIFILGKNDTFRPEYKRDLRALMELANERSIPMKIFPLRTEKPDSSAYILIDRMAFREGENNDGKNYTMSELGDMGGDALALYRQSQEYKAKHPQIPSNGTTAETPVTSAP